ncbi:large ribosomal subunit protein uL11m-like [Clavelina lepadiformis]|uniref:Large ribosomal subunit protein uL11m n=1 Tax=Clavelina lepadiformis TaxID=159417 RepID=A0ABP0GV72_CLALP
MSKLTRASKEVKKVIHPNVIRSIIRAGGATTGPPLGPTLGQRGIPIAKFVTDFNNLTKDIKPGVPLPTRIHIDGKKFSIQIMEPATSFLIKQAAGIKRGKRPTDPLEAGWITHKHVYEIAKVKIEQESVKIRSVSLEDLCQSIAVQCDRMGVIIKREINSDEYEEFLKAHDEMEANYQKEKEEKLLEAKKKLAKKLLKESR